MDNMLLTYREAAARLGVSVATVARLVKEGVLPIVILAERPRRRLARIPREALEQYLRHRER